ncbi:MAG: NAD-dependent protein deacylase [Halanaeroarchaeum sp.]
MSEPIDRLAEVIRSANRVVAFTGAGVSTASGIPDFRGEDGLWEEHDPGLFHLDTFRRTPGEFWERTLALYDDVFPADPSPNAAHEALATLESAGRLDAVITQNADGLHQEAGSSDVVELHGTIERVVCPSCSYREPFEEARERAEEGGVPPTCPECGEPLKPDSVFFGERLPEYATLRAQSLAEKSDAFLVVGSSLTVEPAASLPEKAIETGAELGIVNLEKTPLDDRATAVVHEDVTSVLPALVDAV